jgi:DNA replication protein DnaC
MDSLVYSRLHGNLAALKLNTVESILDSYLQAAVSEEKSFAEVLDYLIEEELKARTASAIQSRLNLSGIPVHKSLDDFDFSFQPSIDRNIIRELRTLRFIHNCENVVLLGPPGVGKTHLATGLVIDAIHAGFSGYYTTAHTMIEKLKKAARKDYLERCLTTFARSRVLVIDEIGYLSLDREGANLFYQVVSRRYEKNSTIFTSNKGFGEWGEVLYDEILAGAILDRILHHCTVLNIKGESYRLKNRNKRGVPASKSEAEEKGKV